ncbi:hypothetical protein [Halarcobacter sp.]|uniref:hypothetical protein n=1 Tax=Halarcobacter sp. TaxID=2321133 RepID=UPI0029F5B7C6|nr:hypothetical protein [Halarcobacter sp.]
MKKLIFILVLTFFSSLNAQEIVVDKLLEKINITKNKEEKQKLLKKLKETLANKNEKEMQEANAIIKAKQKLPSKVYDDTFLNK